MNLYLLRHASAGLRRTNPAIDAKRPLDKEGKQFCIQLGQVLGLLKVQFDLVISSPLKRSLQTAALVGTETGYEAKILTSPALAPGGTITDFESLIAGLSSKDNVLVVGHNPNLTNFLGSLIVVPEIRARGALNGASSNSAAKNGATGSTPAANRAPAHSPTHPAVVRLRKGSLARVNCDPHPASLQWLLDPRIVRALYASSAISSRRKTSRK